MIAAVLESAHGSAPTNQHVHIPWRVLEGNGTIVA